jgi:hypothetical protein
MRWVVFEPTVAVLERVNTFLALDCAASDRLEGLILEYIPYKALHVQQVQLQYRIYFLLLQCVLQSQEFHSFWVNPLEYLWQYSADDRNYEALWYVIFQFHITLDKLRSDILCISSRRAPVSLLSIS